MNFEEKTKYSGSRYFISLPKIVNTQKTRSFAWLSLTIFTITFFLVAAIKPTLVTIAKLNKEIDDKTQASGQLQKKIDAIITAQDIYARNSDNLSLLDEALPERSEFPKVASFFEQEASASGVSLKSLSFERVEETTLAAKETSSLANTPLNFSIVVTSDYPNLKNFLVNLESYRRILQINETAFNRIKKGDSFELLLSISGKASFRKKI